MANHDISELTEQWINSLEFKSRFSIMDIEDALTSQSREAIQRHGDRDPELLDELFSDWSRRSGCVLLDKKDLRIVGYGSIQHGQLRKNEVVDFLEWLVVEDNYKRSDEYVRTIQAPAWPDENRIPLFSDIIVYRLVLTIQNSCYANPGDKAAANLLLRHGFEKCEECPNDTFAGTRKSKH